MRVLTVACAKGGVGKTSVCVGLASALAEGGERVLVVDCDAQGAATRWLGHGRAPGLTAVFAGLGPLGSLVRASTVPRIDVVAAGIGLATLDRTQAQRGGVELQLARALDGLPRRWDTVLLDTPPSLGLVVVASLAAATELIVPVETRPLGDRGLRDLLALAQDVRTSFHPGLPQAHIVLSRTTATRVSREVEAGVRERHGEYVFETTLPERVAVSRASGRRLPVLLDEPHGASAMALRRLAEEVRALRRTERPQPVRWRGTSLAARV